MGIDREAPGAFTAWLRQVRRSAWLLIAICILFRVGDAIIHDAPLLMGGLPAAAGY